MERCGLPVKLYLSNNTINKQALIIFRMPATFQVFCLLTFKILTTTLQGIISTIAIPIL